MILASAARRSALMRYMHMKLMELPIFVELKEKFFVFRRGRVQGYSYWAYPRARAESRARGGAFPRKRSLPLSSTSRGFCDGVG